MPERTPNLHGANTSFHKEVRNQPERRGRAAANAPPPPPVSWAGAVSPTPAITWENGRIATALTAPGNGAGGGARPRGACRSVRYFTGRW
ncbi:hypothetical protein TNCT1_03320 [Streptomyces sp. 1-11]|nr:hypothetical protein TNCT1_03320 [Streptomyces sp. 1-11]